MSKPFFTGILTGLFIFSSPINGISQHTSNPTSGVKAVQYGLWSAVNNPAGLSRETGLSTGFYYQSAFLMQELAEAGLAVAIPVRQFSVFGLSYQQFGYSLYREQHVGLSISKPMGKIVSAGVRMDYLSTAFGNDYGNTSTFSGAAGVIVNVTEEVRIGVTVFNPHRARLGRNDENRYPAKVMSGIAWRFGNHVELSLGADKLSSSKETLSCNLDYQISGKFKLHAGFSNGLKPFYFGYTFIIGRIETSMSSGYHELLGFSPQLILTYKRK